MAGAFLGGASVYHVPVVIDGVIAAAAAAAAGRPHRHATNYAGSPCIGGTGVYLAA